MSQTSEPGHADETDRSAVNARVITFYLPQFHPIPENDEWWEPGFTEWTNVTRARPLYPGHQQPMLPSELGFYDLRVAETRRAQGELASTYGVEAFCYWHYWFGDGRRLLERPFTEVLASGEPSISFCVAWANETWSGAWIGAPDKVLQQQTYPGEADDRAHFTALLPAFRDDRYLTVDGRPVFYVYRPSDCRTPLPSSTVGRLWRPRRVCRGCTWWPRSATAWGPDRPRSGRVPSASTLWPT